MTQVHSSLQRPTPTRPLPGVPPKKRRAVSSSGLVQVALLLVSLISLAISMAGAAVMVFQIFAGTSYGLIAQLISLGLAYFVGWSIALIAIRSFHDEIVRLFVRGYFWIVVAGISALHIIILIKLFEQDYQPDSFFVYVLLILAALIAVWGFALLLNDDSLVFAAIPMVLIDLAHLYLMVFHYLIVPGVLEHYIWGDASFFIAMSLVAALMIANMPPLTPLRRAIDNIFTLPNPPAPTNQMEP